MNETTHTSLISTASTPTTTTTQPATQQTGSASTGMPGWLFTDIPLLSSLLISLGLGSIIAAIITVFGKHWSDTRLDKQKQQHEKELDEVRRKHELEVQRVKTEYEQQNSKSQWNIDKERKQYEKRIELVNTWYSIVSQGNFDREFVLNHPSYGRLREVLSKDALQQIERDPSHLVGILEGQIDPDRALLMKEIARIEKEWNLI